MVEIEGMVTYKYVVFSYPLAVLVLVISKEILHKPSEGIDLHVHGKKIGSFYAFELIIHSLAEEYLLTVN